VSPTISLALATFAFVSTHLLMSHPLRPGLVARLGERGFLGLYSLLSLAILAWMVVAWRQGSDSFYYFTAGYDRALWLVGSLLMLIASILFVGAHVGNPAFPTRGAGAPAAIGPPKGVFAITRHPMNWSFIIWALVHGAMATGPRGLIVAAGIFLLALLGSLGQDRKKERLLGTVWRDWQARTSFVPFAALLGGRARLHGARQWAFALIGGAAFWALAASLHVPPLSPFRELLGR
jgi:uncharacterized membrane protein